jgi:hypothetical protein
MFRQPKKPVLFYAEGIKKARRCLRWVPFLPLPLAKARGVGPRAKTKEAKEAMPLKKIQGLLGIRKHKHKNFEPVQHFEFLSNKSEIERTFKKTTLLGLSSKPFFITKNNLNP